MDSTDIKDIWVLSISCQELEGRIKRITGAGGDSREKMELLRKLYSDLDGLYQKTRYAEERIQDIGDQTTREVMRLRFICGKSVKDVADKLHYSDRQIKRYTKRGFEELKKKELHVSPNVPSKTDTVEG